MFKFAMTSCVIALLTTPAFAFFGAREKTSDRNISQNLETLLKEAVRQVPLPNIVNFFERRMVKTLYELRDNPEYKTITYITTLDGKFVKVCDSIGYGINASIQFSNPEKMIHGSSSHGYGATFTHQAEPNGLFMPEGLDATYVMCLNPEDNELAPVYLEQEITVSPFPLG